LGLFGTLWNKFQPTVFKVLKLVWGFSLFTHYSCCWELFGNRALTHCSCCWGPPLKAEYSLIAVVVESPLKAEHLFMICFGILWVDCKFSPKKRKIYTQNTSRRGPL